MSNSRVLERLLMYERRIENSLHKTLDELHKRKLVREFENANKAIETEDFEMKVHPQATLEAATQLGIKNAKQSQSFDSAQDRFQNGQFNVTSIMTKGCDKSLSVCDYAGTRKQSQSFDSAQDKPKPICTPR
jgi:hypothetical protein